MQGKIIMVRKALGENRPAAGILPPTFPTKKRRSFLTLGRRPVQKKIRKNQKRHTSAGRKPSFVRQAGLSSKTGRRKNRGLSDPTCGLATSKSLFWRCSERLNDQGGGYGEALTMRDIRAFFCRWVMGIDKGKGSTKNKRRLTQSRLVLTICSSSGSRW